MIKATIFFALLLIVSAAAFPVHKAKNGDDCGTCEFLVSQVETFLTDNTTETEVLQKLEGACSLLVNPTWVSDCKNLIGTYGPQLILAVVTKETPSGVCSMIGFCNSTVVTEKKPAVEGSIECWACTYLVKAIEGYIQQNKSQSEILGFLSNDCKILHEPTWVSTCQGLVDAYAPQMIQLLLNKEDPDSVCTQLTLCNSTATNTIVPPVTNSIGGAECMLCDWLLGKLEGFVASNQTEAEMVKGLTDACHVLKESTFVAMCEAGVSEYAPELINMLINEVPPTKACTEIGACSSSKIAAHKHNIFGYHKAGTLSKPKISIAL